MKIANLSLTNYRSYKDQFFDFSDRQIIGVLGKTGSGKSTIIEAVLYALFGRVRDRSEDDVIREGSEEMVVQATVSHMNHKIDIKRIKKRGATSRVEVNEDGSRVNINGGVRAANQIIIDKLGFDYDTFVAISFFRQGLAEEFVGATPSIRRKYLSNLLNNDELSEASERARELQRDNSLEIQRLEGEIGAYTRQLEEVELEEVQLDNISKVRSQISDICNSINGQKKIEAKQMESLEVARHVSSERARIEQLIHAKSRLINESVRRTEEIKLFRARIDEQRSSIEFKRIEWEKEKAAAVVKLQPRPKNIETLRIEMANLKAQFDLKNDELLKINDLDVECPTCKQTVDALHLKSHKSGLSERILSLEKQLVAGIDTFDNLQRIEEAHLDFERQYSHASGPAQDLTSYDIQIGDAHERFEREVAEEKILVKESENLNSQLVDYKKIDLEPLILELKLIKENLAHLVSGRIELENRIGLLTNRLEVYRSVNQLLHNSRRHHQEVLQKKDAIKQVVDAFAIKIPAMVIENVLGGVTAYANNLLAEFGTGFQVNIITQSINSTGEMRETLEIEIKKPDGTIRQYESFSGGQKSIINFSLRLALAQMMAAQSGTPMKSIYLDEVFSGLDSESTQIMMRVVSVLRNMFDQIFMVTHMDTIKDSVPDMIEIKMVNGLSCIS